MNPMDKTRLLILKNTLVRLQLELQETLNKINDIEKKYEKEE